MEFFDQRAFARADRTHQIEHLAALFALERGGVKVSDDLRNGFFDAEEFVGEKIIELYGFVFVESFDVRIVLFMNVAHARLS